MTTQTMDQPIDEMTLEQLESEGFEGIDVSLDISLGEYGLACTYNEEDNDWYCIVGHRTDTAGNYITFYTGWIEEQEIHEIAQDLGGAGFYNTMGVRLPQWKRSPVISKIHDVKNYLGAEVVFGTPRHTFQLAALET